MISSMGTSHTLESLHAGMVKRGVSANNVSQQALGDFLLQSDYYLKHER